MNTFGRIFCVEIYGESHGPEVGVIIDGCPAGIEISLNDFLFDLKRRQAGAKGTTTRIESDFPIIKSGIFNGKTTGSPILISFENNNQNSKDYSEFKDLPRPGHADFTAFKKFKGYNDYRGGGHFSGRLTVALTAAGVIAKKIIGNIKINAKLIEAGGTADIDLAIEEAINRGDSIGGIIECRANNLPVGLGEPFFDSVESLISHIIFSIPAVKGIEFGSGFNAAKMYGSQHNDPIIDESGKTSTNNAGGINGGLTNGNELVFRIAIKPTSSIKQQQSTINLQTGETASFTIQGRHDACIALRVPPVAEAATAIVLADLILINRINI
jgi:chorismate synthase